MGGSGLVLTTVLALVIDSSQRHQLEAQARETATRDAVLVGAAFGRLIDERLALLRDLASRPELASGIERDADLRLALEQARTPHPELAWLAQVDPAGRIGAATNALFEGERYDAQGWWALALTGSTVGRVRRWPALASRLGEATDEERRFLELATPVIDAEGRTLGAFVALLDWRWLRDRLTQVAQPDQAPGRAEALLLRAPAERPDRPVVLIGPDGLRDAELPAGLGLGAGAQAQVQRTRWPDGQDLVSTHVELPLAVGANAGRWSLMLRRPAAEVYAALDQLRRRLLLLTLGGSAIFAALSWALAGRIVRPIERLSQAASRLQDGADAFFAPPPAGATPDEITGLHAALHRMAGELAQRMAAQRATAQRYLALYEASPDGLLVVRQGCIAMVNPAGVALFGARKADDLVGRPLKDFLSPADETVRDAVSATDAPPSGECTLRRLDGQPVPVEVSAAEIRDGESPAHQLVVRDVTERRQAAEAQTRYSVLLEDRVAERTRALSAAMDVVRAGEQRLKQLNADLEVAARRAQAASDAKSAFLANMSHELRTPMNAILGLTHMLQDEPLPARTMDLLATMQASAQALMALLDDLLDYSKIEAGQMRFEVRPLALRELLGRSVALFEARAAQRGLRLRLEVAPTTPEYLAGDPLRIAQVINNLLGNAIKFTESGAVTVRAELAGGDQDELVQLRLAVTDTGIGIAPEVQAQIFEPFTQADASITRRFGGTGLGLAICRRLVQLMDGEIGVNSRPGAGSEFWFRLPLRRVDPGQAEDMAVQPEARSPTLSQLAGRLAALRGAEVLVAEDNPINQLVTEEMLRRLGLRPHTVADGAQAVAAVRAEPARWALVLMDLHMPVLDGLQASEALRRDPGEASPPVVAMSAAVSEDDHRRCLAAGMVAHVDKPVDPQALVEALRIWARRPTPAPTLAPAAPAAPAAPGSTLAVLDRAAALARLGGNPALLDRLLHQFAEQEAGAASRLGEAAAQRRWQELRETAHRLKGGAAALGAARLAAAAAEVERLAQLELAGRTIDASELDAALLQAAAALDTTRLLIQATAQGLKDRMAR